MNLLSAYQDLNYSCTKTLKFIVGIGGGFFSEYNNMLVAMLYCIKHGIQFKLDSRNANFAIDKGWCDYFEPFCEEVYDNRVHYKTVDWRYLVKSLLKGRKIPIVKNVLPYFHCFRKNLLTQDVFGKARSRVAQNSLYNIPQLGINGCFRDACSVLLNVTWKYNHKTKLEIDEIIKQIVLPDQYVGLHIRGGDKALEHQLYPIDMYFEKFGNSVVKNAFILTDDYGIFDMCVRRYPDWNFWTLCEKTDAGYDNQAFVRKTPEAKRRKLVRLFASIEILTNSVQFVGTYTANPGLFLGMRIPEKTTFVDSREWKLW